MGLDGILAAVLAELGEATTRELLAAIRSRGGHGVSRAALERTLDAHERFGSDGTGPRARWQLREVPSAPSGARRDTRASLDVLELRAWQAEAFAAWSGTGRGVVEAVTGTGKTRLALAVIRAVADRGTRTLVLVPTLDLVEQWTNELRRALPDLRLGRLGGGRDDDLFAVDVLVATPHSAASVPIDLPSGVPGLLIADEAHRYGAPTWAAALAECFTLRLALTATYERQDEGVADVLEPYFGEVVFRYGYARAVADGTVAPFRIALVGVELTDAERDAHTAADARVRRLHRELVAGMGMPRDPRALFAAVAAVVADAERGTGTGPQVRACREYLSRVRERRDVAARAEAKLDVCRAAADGLHGRRTLVFTDTIDQAESAAGSLRATGLAAETVHADLSTDKRRIRLAQFRRGALEVVVAPRVLDEGVDVPAADVAIVLAAFRTRRQMVQRLGRVLRVKPDGGEARLVLAHAIGTAEDPSRGGHRDFLAQVRSVARDVVGIELARSGSTLADWLGGTANPSRGVLGG